jgi:hypothetical protein
MPKLNNTQVADRLRKRIQQLQQGEEISAKDVQALLTQEQIKKLNSAWLYQQQLRKGKRAITQEQQRALGWKSKREVRLEILEQALEETNINMLQTMQQLQQQRQVQQTRIYFNQYGAAVDAGHSSIQAKSIANRALTQSHLPRMDGVDTRYKSKRDKEIEEQEQLLKRMLGLSDEDANDDQAV